MAHYILTTVLREGTWGTDLDGKAKIPSIIEYPTVGFEQAINYTRFIYISQKSFKKTEKAMAREDIYDSDIYYIYVGCKSKNDLFALIERIRNILIEATVPQYTTFWLEPMEISSQHGKWVASGIVRGELYGGVSNG